MSTPVTVNFPIDQNEQARQLKAEHLLPQDVYLKIATLIEANLIKLEKLKNMETDSQRLDDIDDCRAHETILIDGGRGAGKSSVLVNLEMFLKDDKCNKTGLKANDLLILKPVDPTLVENGDSLLLNIIVAALMGNKEVTRKLDKSDGKADVFYDQLQKLGFALEAVETRDKKYGIDKLRSFMGGNGLAQEIHKLFKATLYLTGKTLIILPIDDVDTSLHHAFENIEIVRKYLSSPYIIPLVSGDLDLYGEIIWRDFHGRIVKDSCLKNDDAKDKAVELQEEYQRKIMPLNRRIDMPNYDYYVQQNNISVVDGKNKPIISLPILFNWFDVVLHGAINGKENSKLKIPFNSIREMAQFIAYYKDEIKQLAKIIRGTELESNTSFAKKIIDESIILELTEEQIKKISEDVDINNEKPELKEKKENELKHKILTDLKIQKNIALKDNSLLELRINWLTKCSEYFLHDAKAGSLYLVSKANSDWSALEPNKRIFATELFSPLKHNSNKLKSFDRNHIIREAWKPELKDRLEEESSWFKGIIEESILPYPIPEKGLRVSELNKSLDKVINESALEKSTEDTSVILFHKAGSECKVTKEKLEFIYSLMCNKNYYTTFQQSALLCSGRVIELIVLSLIKNVSKSDVKTILQEQPFYSLSYLAPTKPLVTNEDKMGETSDEGNEKGSASELYSEFLTEFVDDINSWRETEMNKSVNPWLVYNVFNKYFNQANIFNDPDKGLSYRNPLLKICNKLQQSFNCLWSCFASFEKGNIFETDEKIAVQNITEATKFDQTNSYKTNIAPLLKDNGKGSITYALAEHPLKKLIDKLNLKEFTLEELTVKITSKTTVKQGDSPTTITSLKKIVQLHLASKGVNSIKDETKFTIDDVHNSLHDITLDAKIDAVIWGKFLDIEKELEEELIDKGIDATLNDLSKTWKGKFKALLIRNKKIQE